MLSTAPEKLSFSGHESFQCRNLWLKKGYDFITDGHSFTDEDAVVELGVGKNMVNAIRYWMKAFGLSNPDTDQPTELADLLLADDGWDPYLEDIATLWLLHYQLVITARASTYSLIFNGLRRDKIEFTRTNFLSFAKRQAEINQTLLNDGTVKSDFDVFVKLYLRPANQTKDRDEGLSGVLTDLNLISTFHRNKEDYYVIENTEKRNLPDAVLLYGILTSGQFASSVNFTTLLTAPNQVGSIFALNATGLYTKLERLVADKRHTAVFSDQAGIRELSFKTKPDPISVLADYYGR
jgi:Protein of unknown function (DUF4007)